MQTAKTCLIQQHLSKIKSSANTTIELFSFFYLLKQNLSMLLDFPFDEEFQVIHKEGNVFLKKILNSKEVQEFLTLLGYTEENGKYVLKITDENFKKIENCLKILETSLIDKEDSSSSYDLSDEEAQEELETQRKSCKKPKSMSELDKFSSKKTKRNSESLKKQILEKHFQKENSQDLIYLQRKKTSLVLFNENGFFQQCLNKNNTKNTRKTKSFLTEFFHKHDGHPEKKQRMNNINHI